MFQNLFQISLSLMIGVFIGWNFHIFYTSLNNQIVTAKNISLSTPIEKKEIQKENNKTTTQKIVHISSKPPQKSIEPKKVKIEKRNSNESNNSNSIFFQFKQLLYTDNFSDAMALYMEANEKQLKEYKTILKSYFSNSLESEPDKTIEEILMYIDIEPESDDIKLYLSEIYIKQKEFKKAIDILFELKNAQESKAIEEKLNLAIQEYIQYLKNSKSYSKLVEFLNDIIERLPDNNENYIIQLAQIYSDLNQYQEAKELLEEIDEDSIYYTKVQTTINKMELNSYQYIIPLVKIGSHYAVNVTVNDIPLVLLLDTGATYTFIDDSVISADIGKEVLLSTAGGDIVANFAKVDSLKIGELELKDFTITLASFSQKNGDGLLGMNFFKQFNFKINQDKNILYLNPK
ncbi:MAG: hypothetical protein GXO60_02940 [Epsilonproteobacteria bacterium]|nr:hypothetical protein [Campylobacterota bacterium]